MRLLNTDLLIASPNTTILDFVAIAHARQISYSDLMTMPLYPYPYLSHLVLGQWPKFPLAIVP